MARGSSVGWFGCSRIASRPGRPSVLRNRVMTRHLRATRIKSWLRISLLTAAAISGVMPRRTRASVASSAASPSSQSRKSPTVRWAISAKAVASWLSRIRRVTSSVSYGISASFRKVFSGNSASAMRAAMRSADVRAATPASTSPERSGVARAIRVARSANCQTWPPRVCA